MIDHLNAHIFLFWLLCIWFSFMRWNLAVSKLFVPCFSPNGGKTSHICILFTCYQLIPYWFFHLLFSMCLHKLYPTLTWTYTNVFVHCHSNVLIWITLPGNILILKQLKRGSTGIKVHPQIWSSISCAIRLVREIWEILNCTLLDM